MRVLLRYARNEFKRYIDPCIYFANIFRIQTVILKHKLVLLSHKHAYATTNYLR